MSYTNDTTSGPPKIVVNVTVEGPVVMNFWAQPAPWAGLKPFEAEFDFPTAGLYGASFELHPLWKQCSPSKARSLTTTAHQNSARSDLLSNRVSKRGQSCPSSSLSDELTDGLVVQSRRVTPHSTVVPQSSLTVPENPSKAAAADLAVDSPSRKDVAVLAATSLLPTATDSIESPLGSSPRSGQKRGRHDDDEDGRPSKRGRVLGTQDDTRRQGV